MQRLKKYFVMVVILMAGCHKDNVVNKTTIPTAGPKDFLAQTNYDKLVIQFQYVNGYAPSASTLNDLTVFLQARLNKPSGISIVSNAISSPGKSVYSVADLQAVESTSRLAGTGTKTLTAYFFFADGDYSANSGNSKVLGITYGTSSVAIFEKTIKGLAGGVTQPPLSTLELIVMEHEFGHLLGLVNFGTAMVAAHQDTAHGNHCDDTSCLMYYNVETSDVIANIVGGSVPPLNAKCLDDLKANGGK